eukprot:12967588-Ditylum_brightwellii.AAC.1
MQIKTCIEGTSGSAKRSGHSTDGMPPCSTYYRSRLKQIVWGLAGQGEEQNSKEYKQRYDLSFRLYF